jgi:hypothetical protein
MERKGASRAEAPTLDLTSQDPVLRRQILVPQQEFLIGHSGDVSAMRAQSILDSP